jgi:PPM family protein phosphatase
MVLEYRAAALTDVGKKRKLNEDAYLVVDGVPLYAVADGMGGHACGEVASKIAVDTLRENLVGETSRAARGKITPAALSESMRRAVEEANRRIVVEGAANEEKAGLGTTCSALAIAGKRYVVAQVGDSRVYMRRSGKVTQMTEDHSFVWELYRNGAITYEELEKHPRKNIVTRALGAMESVEVDLFEGDVEEGDRFLVCSDGLSGVIQKERLEALLNWSGGPEEVVALMIENALAAGGHDNITAIVVDVTVPLAKRRKSLIPNILLVYTLFVVAILLSWIG